ncbi:AraC family transcriptional regulator [Polaromonas jejuensis]|uniref:AraC family transcriptional regulator n=1 Tax=Polaromonas jejuensis TaxID=457502 RepID=A0ABW0QGJ4_9BURK|nr:AraC family transcriptional regulator [Polaromonas jejuensis]
MERSDNRATAPFKWSTSDFPPSERLDAYAGMLDNRILSITTSSPVRFNFKAELTAAQLGPLIVSRLGGSTHDAYRTRKDIARAQEFTYLLTVGVGCSWRHWKKDREALLLPGDVLLADTREELSVHWPPDCLALNVRLPIEWLQAWIADPRQLVGRRISGDAGWGKVLSNYMSQVTPELAMAPPLPAQVMADQMGALLALAAQEVLGYVPESQAPDVQQCDRIHACIEQRCSELQLTAADVAASLNLSPRTLHRTLAAHGETFGKTLIDARLDVAFRMLLSRTFDRITVAEIGKRAGFLDPSHFSRVCRLRFGHTPNSLRQNRAS